MALSKEKLEKLTDRSTDIVVATDRKGIVVYYNDGATRSLGYRPDEVLGSFVGKLYPSLSEAQHVMKAMREQESDATARSVQTLFVAKDGTEIPVAISGTVLRAEDGEEDGSIGYAKDLREILRKDQLATLGEVAIGLSHEINNPLAVILNQTELLERDVSRMAGEADISVETERLDAIRREVVRVSGILSRLGEMVETETYETVDYAGPARMLDLRTPQGSSETTDAQLRGLRVLVVDDDLGIRTSLKEVLEGWGCAVDTAEDGSEALACAEREPIDLVLSDVVMPKMDGHELFLALQERKPDLPVLMMTAFHFDKDHIIKRSRMKGVRGVIFKKPVDPAKLREIMVETLSQPD